VTDLGQAIQQLQALEQGDYDKEVAVEGGLEAVIQKFKNAEFSARRTIEKDAMVRPVLGGNPDVPADYKPLVSDYYKALAEVKK